MTPPVPPTPGGGNENFQTCSHDEVIQYEPGAWRCQDCGMPFAPAVDVADLLPGGWSRKGIEAMQAIRDADAHNA
jgi:hypothetical protein